MAKFFSGIFRVQDRVLMKIALCQINPTLGSFTSNQKLIEKNYHTALENGADLVVFPEMSITGYPPQDLLLQKDFIKKTNEVLLNISKICNHIFIEEVPVFNEYNSNQQLRFITLIDILYEKKISLTLSMESDLSKIGTSKKHSEIFKRTTSRLHEMTMSKYS